MRPQEAEASKRDAILLTLAPEMWQKLLSHVQTVAQEIEDRLQGALVDPMQQLNKSHPRKGCLFKVPATDDLACRNSSE